MLLKSYLGSIARVAELDGYAATIDGFAGGPPVSHWRLGEAGGLEMRDRKGARHGTYSNPEAIGFGAAALPQDSAAGAVDFAGAGYATVPHDGDLALPELSVSLWFRLPAMPVAQQAILFSKDGSGLVNGDLVIAVEEQGELYVHIQDTATSHRVSSEVAITANTVHHVVATADNTGFALWHNGRYMGKNTSFTGAWSSNTRDIQIAKVAWQAALTNAIIDEIALYQRVLAEDEVLALSQSTEAPMAAGDTAVVPESATTVIDVVVNDTFVGTKAGLSVQITAQPGGGDSVAVNGNNDIEYTAGAVSQDTARSFSYRITDANGTSNTATVNLTVQDSASEGGGTLVYDWQAQASWIDGVPRADRDTDDVFGAPTTGGVPFDPAKEPNPNRWKLSTANGGGVLVGSSLVKGTNNKGTQSTAGCWNRAPDGTPALELYTISGQHNVADFAIRLYDALEGTGARHLRVVMEIWLCDSNDPTTYKGQGQGPTGGSYPNYQDCIEGSTQYCWSCVFQGVRQEGPIFCNRWGDSSLTLVRIGHLISGSGSSGNRGIYVADFGRAGSGTFQSNGTVKFADCCGGQWHRTELEIKLTDPNLVPDDARRSEPETDPNPHPGDGEARLYLTPDIDGILGPSGTRVLNGEATGLLFNPKFDDVGSDDNMHTLNDLSGAYLLWYFGGSGVAQSEAWVWIRRVQVYRHD